MGPAAARAPAHVPPRPRPFVPSSVTPGICGSLLSGLRENLLGQPALAANKPPTAWPTYTADICLFEFWKLEVHDRGASRSSV